MKAKISAGFSGVIATGSYENTRPSFSNEVEVEINSIEELADWQKRIYDVCFTNFKQEEERQIVERITKERKDIRFYNGFPSVTSVINWDADFFVSPQDLQEYASHGNLYHAQVAHYITTGEWLEPQDIEGTWTDLVIIKKGKLQLPIGDWNFPAFLKKYPFEKMENGKTVISQKHKFGGTSDIRICYFNGKKTLADVKRTPDKEKHFQQCAAYILAEEENGEPPYEQMALIPASGKTEQGFSKPITSTDINQFKNMFLKKRESFQKRFGI